MFPTCSGTSASFPISPYRITQMVEKPKSMSGVSPKQLSDQMAHPVSRLQVFTTYKYFIEDPLELIVAERVRYHVVQQRPPREAALLVGRVTGRVADLSVPEVRQVRHYRLHQTPHHWGAIR